MGRCTLVVLVLVLALAAGGCNLVFGLEPPSTEAPAVDAPAAPADDAGAADAVSRPDGDVLVDASEPPIDAPIDPPIDGPMLPIDGPPGPCTPVNDFNECTFDVCVGGVPMNPPVPRDTLCNNLNDQCDGDGACVDCTTSGGCGECCTCSMAEVCVPA